MLSIWNVNYNLNAMYVRKIQVKSLKGFFITFEITQILIKHARYKVFGASDEFKTFSSNEQFRILYLLQILVYL